MNEIRRRFRRNLDEDGEIRHQRMIEENEEEVKRISAGTVSIECAIIDEAPGTCESSPTFARVIGLLPILPRFSN
ncbi:GL19754 [Drosophila persimilis]|uniref:GL19754 n=1 Tax=Drosophila persimilis TaxID=7234 RepID=B4IRX6_DROPE|nr:GL22927 [Drosophila persimilis]EDW39560.1 GL19754 [Drosophila persimilis]